MTRSKSRSLVSLLVLIIALVALPAAASAAPPPTQGIHIRPIGHPTWAPVDFHLFSAPVGTAESGYVEFGETTEALLPPPNHLANPVLGIGPGAPHSGYDTEMAAGVAANGYHEGVRFNQSEFSNGAGIWMAWMNVPFPGTMGSSPDFDSGPIIPNSLFPIHVNAVSNHNGASFSGVFDGDVPALDGSICDNCAVDGHSHFPFFLADNADFGPPGGKLRGSYDWEVTMTDATGNGWRIDVHFAVAP